MAEVPSTANLNALLTQVVDQIDETIHLHLFATNPYESIIQRGVFDAQRGLNPTALEVTGTLPEAYPTFHDLTLSNGVGNQACDPPPARIQFGQTERPYTIEFQAFDTEIFCITDLEFAHQFRDQIAGIERSLANYVTTYIADRARLKNIALCDYKASAVDPQPFEIVRNQLTGWGGNTAPTVRLDWPHVDQVYDNLTALGKGYATPIRGEGGEIVFPFILGPMIKRMLFRENAARVDVYYTTDSPLNFRSRGLNKAYRGMFPIIDPFPLRYTEYEGGIGSLVYPFRNVATTLGMKFEPNPAYKPSWMLGGTTVYEVAFVYTREVYKDLVRPPSPLTIGMERYDPQNYSGQVHWINNRDMEHNPLGNMGFYRVDVQMSAQPMDPEAGTSIIFRIPTLAEQSSY